MRDLRVLSVGLLLSMYLLCKPIIALQHQRAAAWAISYRITWMCDGCQVDVINSPDKGFNGHAKHDSWGNAVAWPTQWIETDRVK